MSSRTEIYQPIVRVLFEARQASRMALTTAEVAAELARHDELRFHAPEHLDVSHSHPEQSSAPGLLAWPFLS